MLPIVASDSPRRSFSATASGTEHVASLRRTVRVGPHDREQADERDRRLAPDRDERPTTPRPCARSGPRRDRVRQPEDRDQREHEWLPGACDRISERFGFGSGGRSERRKVPCSAVSTDMVVAMLAVAALLSRCCSNCGGLPSRLIRKRRRSRSQQTSARSAGRAPPPRRRRSGPPAHKSNRNSRFTPFAPPPLSPSPPPTPAPSGRPSRPSSSRRSAS